MKYLCEKIVDKILDMAITAAIGAIISYVTGWCWNQASVQEMRRKFEELLDRAKMVNPTAQQSNTANLQVQQLLRELQNEAEQESQPGLVLKISGPETREKFEGERMVNPTAQQSNTANLQFQQLPREVQNEAEQESQSGLVLKISGPGAREKFERARMVNPTAQQSNTANLQFQQLPREVQNEAEQDATVIDTARPGSDNDIALLPSRAVPLPLMRRVMSMPVLLPSRAVLLSRRVDAGAAAAPRRCRYS